jgi:hypothetical protein
VDEQLRAEDVEVYYDPGELLGGLLKGPKVAAASSEEDRGAVALAERLGEAAAVSASGAVPPPQACPFLNPGKPQ